MTIDHEGSSSVGESASSRDSAYTSLSSLMQPKSGPKSPASPRSKSSHSGEQQKLLSPTPIRKGQYNRLYTVSERSEGGSARSSPNSAGKQRDSAERHDALTVGDSTGGGRSRSRSPAPGAQGSRKKANAKKSVWSIIALTISMGGAQVSLSPMCESLERPTHLLHF